MKIAEVVATFPPYHGGMGHVCLHNALELAKRGHDITVFTLDHRRRRNRRDPDVIEVTRLKNPLIYGDGGVVPHLYLKLREFDAVHLHYPFFGGAEYVYLASLLRGQKYLLTYHMDVHGNNFFKKMVIGCYESLLMKRIIRGATKIVALSKEHMKSSKISGFVDWGSVVEIPNGVDTERFLPLSKDKGMIDKYGLSGKTVVLFVGNLQPFKGLHLLIDALSKIRNENIVLLIVGGGYGEVSYKKMVEDKGLENRVIFAGPKSPDKDLPACYNISDFLVLPSTHSESFGLVVLEAMASGKPAIVSSLPGPSQLIADGKDGLIVKIGDSEDLKNKIEYLAHNKKTCELMGKAGRQKALEKYSWGKVGDSLERTFKEMIQ